MNRTTRAAVGGGPFRFLPFLLLLWMAPLLLSPLSAFFEATSHWTGWMAVAPLVLVLVILVGGGLLLATLASRKL